MISWFQQSVVDTGRLRLFCFFVSFIAAFLFIRASVRMIRAQVRWWPGNVTPGGVHVHHVVFGVVFMCVGAVGGLAVQDTRSGWAAAAAALLGVGVALVLDEFALVLRLQDVYWSEQGRLSVEVVFIAAALVGLALLGWVPLGATPGSGAGRSRFEAFAGVVIALAINLSFTVICLLKGKIWCGVIGIYIGLLAFIGAIRLARPGSPWARRRYPDGSRKLTKAIAREKRYGQRADRFRTRIQDAVGGRPDQAGDRRRSLVLRVAVQEFVDVYVVDAGEGAGRQGGQDVGVRPRRGPGHPLPPFGQGQRGALAAFAVRAV